MENSRNRAPRARLRHGLRAPPCARTTRARACTSPRALAQRASAAFALQRRPGERGRAAPRAGSLRSRRGSRLFPLRLLLVRGGEREVAALAVDALGGQRAVEAGRDLVPVLALDGDLRVDRAVAIDDEYVRVVAPVIGRRRREAAVVPVVVEMGRAWRIRSEWAPSLLGRSNRRTASTW